MKGLVASVRLAARAPPGAGPPAGTFEIKVDREPCQTGLRRKGALLHSTALDSSGKCSGCAHAASHGEQDGQPSALDQIWPNPVDQHGMSTLLTKAHVVEETPAKCSPAQKWKSFFRAEGLEVRARDMVALASY